jgi:GABA(A) receptor-associated protein
MPSNNSKYKKNTTFEERLLKSSKMISLYPDRIPVIVEMSPSSFSYNTYMKSCHKIKYLVPYNITMGQFIQILRDKIKIESSIALFFFINNKIFPITSLIGDIYKNNADPDGFLYIEFCEESTFGSST